MLRKFIVIVLSVFLCQFAYATGGVSLGATRIIYPSNAKQVSLKVYNSDKNGNYLVQSWVTNSAGEKTNDFIVTPPLFVLKSDANNVLRIVYSGNKDSLPKDRESLFYFHSKVIPSTADLDKSKNMLLISNTSKLKLFVRPNQLDNIEDSMKSHEKLQCSYLGGQIKIENPTPYYVNLVNLRLNGKNVSNAAMVPPMSSVSISSKEKGSSLVFHLITDYGSLVKDQQCALK